MPSDPRRTPRLVLIVGGGLAGLLTARRLPAAGVDFELREARSRLGGRILTADAAGAAVGRTASAGAASEDGFDLGPSWFWPRMQPAMAALVAELGLATFPQHSTGDVVFQRMSRESPQRYRGTPQEPESMRVVGGTGALVRAIASQLDSDRLRLASRLTALSLLPDRVEARFVGEGDGPEDVVQASHIILALPPRLLASTVAFSPALDQATMERWLATPTWMAPHAKFFALYDRPFWREEGLSGTAQSMAGPLAEIHDATTAAGEAALFGFIGISAGQRRAMGEEAIVAASVRQLVTLFGPGAGTPRATMAKDWATDPLTATDQDWTDGAHPTADDRPWIEATWSERVTLAGSETSPTEPGYLAGAVHAAERAARDVTRRVSGVGVTEMPSR